MTTTFTPDYHEGPAVTRYYAKEHRVMTLCPVGHLVAGYELNETFGGSWLEAQLSNPNWTHRIVRCYGAVPTREEHHG